MNEFESIEEYIKSLRPLPIAHLEWMAQNIDKEIYPDRYKAIVDTISDKRSRPKSFEEITLPTEKPTSEQYRITVAWHQYFFKRISWIA